MQTPRIIRHPLFWPIIILLLLLPLIFRLGGQLNLAHAQILTKAASKPLAQNALPPTLLSTEPADGAAWSGATVTFTFDQPLDPASTIAFTVEPALPGEVVIADNTLTFTPTAAPNPGERYRLLLDADATGTNSIALGTPAQISLVAATPVAVTSTQPSADAEEVAIDSQLVIVFNKPVVALVGIDDQSTLPQPLTLEPVVEGKGEWLNTSIYVFKPTLGLAGGTRYQATVADFSGLNGEALGAPYTFAFMTAAPIVTDAHAQFNNPYSSAPTIGPESSFVVSFSQPMDQASTAAAFAFVESSNDNAPVAGSLGWSADQRTLTFTPTVELTFGGSYELTIDTSAQPASQQGNLREVHTSTFLVAPLPAVIGTNPDDGATNMPPDMTITLQFNTTISETTLLPNISVTPTLTTTQVAIYYRSWENAVDVNWFREAGTTYTVTVGADVADIYGNTLGEPTSFSFTTGDQSAFVRMGIERFTHFSAYTETRVSTLYRNVSSVDARLYRLPADELLRLGGDNQWEVWQDYQVPNPADNLIWERNYEPIVGPNVTARQIISLTTVAGDLLDPGLYMLEVTYPERKPDPQGDPFTNPTQAVIVLSNNNLLLKKSITGESLAWVTDLQTGAPVADQPVRFYQTGTAKGEATTDGDGIARTPLNLNPDNSWTPVIALSGTPGEPNFAAASSEWSQGIGPWDFNISGGYATEAYQSYFYTDRPIYRPGQTIYWKGIVRQLVDDQYELPPTDLPVKIIVRNDQGETVVEGDYTPTANGTLNGEVMLGDEAGMGFYYLEARLQVEPERTVYGGASFQVAAYRKPEFAISVTSDKAEYRNGETISVTVRANYFSGGALGNAPLTWRLIAEPYFFNWQDHEGRYYDFTPYDPENEDYDPYRSTFSSGMVREGIGTTEADGSFTLVLPADLSMALQSQRWTIDATVQSPTNQFVSGQATFPVHKGAFYIGLSPRSYVAQVGQESAIDLVTIEPIGIAYPGAEVAVTIYKFEWNSVYAQGADGSFAWQTSVERTPVYTTSLLTGRSGDAAITWIPEAGGQYQVVATGVDDHGNQVSSATFLWVSGQAFVAWPRENNDRIELVADRDLYKPGDTAQILVPSPFTGTVTALLTLERGGVLDSRLVTLNGNSETLAIPITSAHIPNLFVSVVIVKGIDASNPTPAMRLGYLQLNVDTAEKALTIDVEPSATVVQPGEMLSYTLTVKDYTGAVVPNAEVSVVLVDKAVLSLAQGDTRSMLDIFYTERPLGVTTAASLNINRDRLSQQLSEGAKGGGGGGGGPGMVEVREEFPDIAFWRAALLSDANGLITFSVTLPDNLTTWTLAAKAVTAETLVGEITNDVVATKALQIRPLLPRFFTAGDRASISAIIRNTTADAITDGTLTFTIDGSEIDFETNQERFSAAAGGDARIDIPIAVSSTVTEVVVFFEATVVNDTVDDPAVNDAIRVRIPVVRYETPEVVGTSGTVPAAGQLEAIRLPASATENGDLTITLEPSLAAGMRDGLAYLEHYEYECNEQTVSRFLPNLFTVRALTTLGIADPALERQLNFQLGVGVQRLVSRQNDDGGWGYWPGEASNAFVTSYVLWGLHHAMTMAYTVPQQVIDSAVDYLDRQFQAPQEVTSDWLLNEMAFMNFVLSEVGEGDPGRTVTLYAVRERLDYYGQALLAMTLANLDGDSGLSVRAQTVLDDLYGAAQLSATGASWHEGDTDWWTLNTDTRTTSMVLAAFVRLDPQEPLLPMVVRWLMDARKAGHWATTQENAWAIIALTDWMAESGELKGNYDWSVSLNGTELGAGNVGPDNVDAQVALRAAVTDLLRDEANALQFSRNNDSGQLYYTTQLRYYLDALAIDARDRGIIVDRRFELAGKAVESADVGDVISVTVTIIAPRDLYQALIEVPIPAGTEPIDPNLATTSVQYDQYGQLVPVDSGRPWWWWSPTNIDLRDEKMALMATYLPAGTYEYTFQVQATVPGEYRVLPAHGEMIYFPEVWGRSAGSLFVLRE